MAKDKLAEAPEIDEYVCPVEISEEQLPQIKDWSVGKSYRIAIEVEMTSQSKKEWGKNKGKICASFKVKSAKSLGQSTAAPAAPVTKKDKLEVVKDRTK